MTLVLECPYEPPHVHEFPDDWEFAGADGTDPRADHRYRSDTWVYLDATLHEVHLTQVPLCDDQAIDEFTKVAGWGLNPVYLQVKRAGTTEFIVLEWKYDEQSDQVSPL